MFIRLMALYFVMHSSTNLTRSSSVVLCFFRWPSRSSISKSTRDILGRWRIDCNGRCWIAWGSIASCKMDGVWYSPRISLIWWSSYLNGHLAKDDQMILLRHLLETVSMRSSIRWKLTGENSVGGDTRKLISFWRKSSFSMPVSLSMNEFASLCRWRRPSGRTMISPWGPSDADGLCDSSEESWIGPTKVNHGPHGVTIDAPQLNHGMFGILFRVGSTKINGTHVSAPI